MKRTVLLVILRVAKLTGLFALARLLTAGDLRILCYHGTALRAEHHFRQGLFMGKETFAARIALRSDEHTSELQSLMRNSSAVFCLKKKKSKTSIAEQSY